MKKSMCQWVEIRKKRTNLQILSGNPCRYLEGDDPCYPDQFEKTCVISKHNVLFQVTNEPSVLHKQTSTISDLSYHEKKTRSIEK